MKLIDRDAAIEVIADKQDGTGMTYEVISHAIRDIQLLPTIPERKPQWISCRERLPDDDGEVLVSTHDFVCRGFYTYGKWYGCSYGSLYDVTAWMPLPEPYREEGAE